MDLQCDDAFRHQSIVSNTAPCNARKTNIEVASAIIVKHILMSRNKGLKFSS